MLIINLVSIKAVLVPNLHVFMACGLGETKRITSQRKVIDNCFEQSTGFSPTVVSHFYSY